VEEDEAIAGWLEPDVCPLGVPLRELSLKTTGSPRSRNLVALGALVSHLQLDAVVFEETVERRFGGKGEGVLSSVMAAYREGYAYAEEHLSQRRREPLGAPAEGDERVIISGNEAAARAAVDAGLALYAGYPITPATKIMEVLAKELPKHGGVVVQTEDEISAAGFVLGAGFAGRRALTATSGPGLCLMSEFINLGVMSETPMVIIDSQRAGPSTGMPTKTEQADLLMACFGPSGDSPRLVLAPGDVAQCYELTAEALRAAEKYQTPVILLLDFFLSNRLENITLPEKAGFEDVNLYPAGEELENYRRYRLTESGISPRAVPGQPEGMFAATGLEHDEMGRPDYTSANHLAMSAKRTSKLLGYLAEGPRPRRSGDEGQVDLGIISWGSAMGAVREALDAHRGEGADLAALQVITMNPLHADDIGAFIAECRKVIVIELNHGGQLASLVAPFADKPLERYCRAKGEPFTIQELVEAIGEHL